MLHSKSLSVWRRTRTIVAGSTPQRTGETVTLRSRRGRAGPPLGGRRRSVDTQTNGEADACCRGYLSQPAVLARFNEPSSVARARVARRRILTTTIRLRKEDHVGRRPRRRFDRSLVRCRRPRTRRSYETTKRTLLAVDHSARVSMKSAASCVN